jgi:hypothetical protein
LAGFQGQGDAPAGNDLRVVPTDSALTSLVIQIGLLGSVLFYAALFWAARRDPPARPFYCVVALCTLTINVGELFPVNVLMGIALAHSASQPWRSETAAASGNG